VQEAKASIAQLNEQVYGANDQAQLCFSRFKQSESLQSQNAASFNLYYAAWRLCHENVDSLSETCQRFCQHLRNMWLEYVKTLATRFQERLLDPNSANLDKNQLMFDLATQLLRLQFVADSIIVIRDQTNVIINDELTRFVDKCSIRNAVDEMLQVLTQMQEANNVVDSLIRQHPIFQRFINGQLNRLTSSANIDYVLKEITTSVQDGSKAPLSENEKLALMAQWTEFNKHYMQNIDKFIDPNAVAQIKEEFPRDWLPRWIAKSEAALLNMINSCITAAGGAFMIWGPSQMKQVPKLLAFVFTLWTLRHAVTSHYFHANEAHKDQLKRPHVAQIIAVFRMLCVSMNSPTLVNNLVQIKTGEGYGTPTHDVESNVVNCVAHPVLMWEIFIVSFCCVCAQEIHCDSCCRHHACAVRF
jgi:hypothetical protein